MVKRYTPRRRSYKKPLMIGTIILVVAALAVGAFFVLRDDTNDQQSKREYTKTSTGHDVNLDPPTEEEKQEAEANKDVVSELQNKDSDNTATPSGSAKPFITYVGQEGQAVEVTGYVLGVFEEGGSCKATFVKDSLKVTAESKGIEDASHTTCPPISIPRAQFTQTGAWKVTLSYQSAKASGTSEPRNITIE